MIEYFFVLPSDAWPVAKVVEAVCEAGRNDLGVRDKRNEALGHGTVRAAFD